VASVAQEGDPFATPPAGTPRQQEPPGFHPWEWACGHPLLALLIAVWLTAWGYAIASGMYLLATDPT